MVDINYYIDFINNAKTEDEVRTEISSLDVTSINHIMKEFNLVTPVGCNKKQDKIDAIVKGVVGSKIRTNKIRNYYSRG